MAKKSAKSGPCPAPDGRAPRLAEMRRQKMARSAHAYVRGSATRFYEWLDSRCSSTLPAGPAVWICGDCHLGNLGPIADAAGDVAVQIRDLDQSVIGNPVHDLLRLGLSLATAARSADLPGVITSRMAEALIDGYEQAFGGACRNEAGGDSWGMSRSRDYVAAEITDMVATATRITMVATQSTRVPLMQNSPMMRG